MLAFLILFSLLLLGIILYLNFIFYRDRKKFRLRIAALEAFIQELGREQDLRSGQLQLSDDLRKKLLAIHATLSNDIFDLNYDLFDRLSENGLLQKEP